MPNEGPLMKLLRLLFVPENNLAHPGIRVTYGTAYKETDGGRLRDSWPHTEQHLQAY